MGPQNLATTTESDLRSMIAALMHGNHVMVIATTSGQRPWVATVFYAFDEALTLYFVSDRRSRHAQELVANCHVAAVVHGGDAKPGGACGLQLDGKAEPVGVMELPHALKTYARRFPWARDAFADPKRLLEESGRARFYKVAPASIIYLDEARFGPHGRREWTPTNHSPRSPAEVAEHA